MQRTIVPPVQWVFKMILSGCTVVIYWGLCGNADISTLVRKWRHFHMVNICFSIFSQKMSNFLGLLLLVGMFLLVCLSLLMSLLVSVGLLLLVDGLVGRPADVNLLLFKFSALAFSSIQGPSYVGSRFLQLTWSFSSASAAAFFLLAPSCVLSIHYCHPCLYFAFSWQTKEKVLQCCSKLWYNVIWHLFALPWIIFACHLHQ